MEQKDSDLSGLGADKGLRSGVDVVSGVDMRKSLATRAAFIQEAKDCVKLSEGTHQREVYPAERWAFLELIGRKVVIQTRERRTAMGADILKPESTDLKARLRYGRRQAILPHWQYLGPRYGKGLSCYEEALVDVWKGEKIQKFVNIVIFFTYGLVVEKDVEEMLKYLSGYAKKFGCSRFAAVLGGDLLAWKAFVNLEVLGGFMDINSDDLRDQVVGWRGGDIVHKSFDPSRQELTEKMFLQDFRRGARSFFRTQLRPAATTVERLELEKYFTYDYFVSHPSLWGGAGSSSEAPTIPGVRKSKWATALGLPTGMVESWLNFEPIQRNKVIGKRETGKIRAVIASDDQLYLAMSYISHWIETLASHSRISTLFMSSEQVAKMWSELTSSCRNGGTTKLPLDQSHFDWQQNKRMLKIVVDEMKSFVMPFVSDTLVNDVHRAFDYVDTALQNPKGYVLFGKTGEHFSIEKGVMSGWRWTALIDTICNYAEMWCACAFCTRMGIFTYPLNLCVQGDDDCVEFVDDLAAGAICTAYARMNFEVNPGKFFMSHIQNEYLRLLATSNGVVSGYPARAIPSILARNPLTVDPPKGVFRIRETFSQWSTLFGRCLGLCDVPFLGNWNNSRVHSMMMDDLCGATGLAKETLFRIEHTPAAFGGLGVLPFVENTLQLGLSLTNENSKRQNVGYTGGVVDETPRNSWTNFHWDKLEEELPGLRSDKEELTSAGFSLKDSDINRTLSSLLQPKGAKPSVQHSIILKPTTIVKVEKSRGLSPILNWSSGGAMPVPKFVRVVRDSVFRNAVVSAVVGETKSENYKENRDRLLDPDSWGDSDKFWSHGGKRMWCMWMRGDLEGAQLSVPGVAGFAMGWLNSLADKWIWKKVSSRSAFSHLDWIHYCVLSQSYANEFVKQLETVLNCHLLS